MFGLTILQEAALAMVWLRQDELAVDMSSAGLTKELLALRDQGMIRMQTDMSGQFAFVQSLNANGREHYDKVRIARRRFKAVSDEADELLGLLCGEAKKQRKAGPISLTYHEGRVGDYRELDSKSLIKVSWAGNMPYMVDVTDDGWSYVEGWFLDQETPMELNINPVFNNNVNASQAAAASATATANGISLGLTLNQVNELDLEQSFKAEVVTALMDLDNASREKDKKSFMEKLEMVASLAKSVSTLAGVVLPFIADAISKLG